MKFWDIFDLDKKIMKIILKIGIIGTLILFLISSFLKIFFDSDLLLGVFVWYGVVFVGVYIFIIPITYSLIAIIFIASWIYRFFNKNKGKEEEKQEDQIYGQEVYWYSLGYSIIIICKK